MGEFLEFWGISSGFPFFVYQPLKAWHSLHLRTERYMTPPDGYISCVRPIVPFRLKFQFDPLGQIETVSVQSC